MTVANISWITEQIATGGDFSYNPDKAVRQYNDLMDMGIDLIIDCRFEDNDADIWEHEESVTYLHLPVDDNYGEHLPTEHFDAAVEAARPVLEAGGKVFVHCHMGINRGPSTAYALLLDQGVPATRAFDKIRSARPQAAVYYAEDALVAHMVRKGFGTTSRVWKERIERFRQHHSKVFTRKEWNNVQHIIRSNHDEDKADRLSR